MKSVGRIAACLLLALALLLTAGCGNQDAWETAEKAAGMLSGMTEDPQLRADTEKLLDALIADDYETALGALYEGISEGDFRQMYTGLQPHLAGITHYELIASSINKTVKNGVASTNVRYMMTAGELRLLVDVARVEGYEGLTAFYVNEYQPVETTGTLGSMQGADAAQWGFLVFGMLEIVFTILVFVDCCRHKMKKKWLWLLLIALGYVILSIVAVPEQFRINFNVGGFLSYTSLIYYSTGGATCQIVIPAGAIAYLCVRKSLFAKYAQLQQQKAAEQETVGLPQEEVVPQTEVLPEPEEE